MRVLILSSSTGGGHDMRARAFSAWASRLPELQLTTQVHRPLDSGPGLYRFGVGFYNWIQRRAPWLHHGYFNFLELTKPCGSVRGLLGKQSFREALLELKPDVLLSVHGSLNHGYFEFARSVLKNVRCVTYCGELHGGYGFSRNWVNPKADIFIGAVPETCAAAAKLGMPTAKTKLGGFLLRPSFYDPPPSPTEREEFIREELKFSPHELILLLSASSRGANNHIAFLEVLRRKAMNVQTVVLCGKSPEAERQVTNWFTQNPAARARVLPYNTDVAKLLRCVSVVIARPGTGATSEAILSECPILLNCLGGAMPQENITVKFCRQHGLAETLHRSDDLPRLLANFQAHPDNLNAIRERMRTARPTAQPVDLLRWVASVA